MNGWQTLHLFSNKQALQRLFAKTGISRMWTWLMHSCSGFGIAALIFAVGMVWNPDWRTMLAKKLMPPTLQSESVPSAVMPGIKLKQEPEFVHLDATAQLVTNRDEVRDSPSMPQAAARLAAQIPGHRIDAEAKDSKVLASVREQMLVAKHISRSYRVAADATAELVKAAYLTGQAVGLDPLLILAVIAVESRFNPYAESVMGAQGLMQVMTRVHRDKYEHFGGAEAALNPLANIKVGALVLKDCIARGGSLERGLRLYVGASTADTDGGYGEKVLEQRTRLRQASLGRSNPTFVKAKPVAPVASMVQPKPPINEAMTATPQSAETGGAVPSSGHVMGQPHA